MIAWPRRRAGKEWEAFAADNDDAIILTADEMARAEAMASAVQANTYAMRALEGERERTLHWTLSGVLCRATPDAFGGRIVTDLKTCRSAKPAEFQGQAIRMAYHAQLCWYAEAIRTLGLGDPDHLHIVAVESAPPYPVVVYRLTQRAMEAGTKLWRSWWERFMVCRQSRTWPGYSDAVVELDAPEEYELEWGGADEPNEAAA